MEARRPRGPATALSQREKLLVKIGQALTISLYLLLFLLVECTKRVKWMGLMSRAHLAELKASETRRRHGHERRDPPPRGSRTK
jgi:hypothetical protein